MFKKFFQNVKATLFKGHAQKPKAEPPKSLLKTDIPKANDKGKVVLTVRRIDRRRQGDRNTAWVKRRVDGKKRTAPTKMPPFDGLYLSTPGEWVKGRKQRGGYGRAA